ncbi:hypothetical protein ACJIZ3_014644 [Penstemon smallii]|uniref:BHLH domain-containing protein n=1 Tax=Penstemon smallii TaxID=265156 RepID=A0ABD3RNL4_9LAMI
MGSGNGDLVDDRVNISTRSCPSKKNSGKVPRKIHKAEREKLKRDHMNELFLDLGKALAICTDLDHVNNGKASMLRETVRLLKELFTQVDNLKKENVALLSESNYVTIEKNELIEDTSALDAQIKNLQREIEEKANCSNSNTSLPEINKESAPTSILSPVFVMPLNHETQGFQVPYSEVNMPKVLSSVSRPRPRYPSSSDIWPSQILTKQTTLADDV